MNPRKFTQSEKEDFLRSIAPPKDLICPITLTLFQEPVLALGDGNTYEKQSILSWFQAKTQLGGMGGHSGVHVRSPITNAFMDSQSGDPNDALKIIPNKIVADMVRHFREELGKRLCNLMQEDHIILNEDHTQDEDRIMFQISSLMEIGADLTVRIPGDVLGDTALMKCIRLKNHKLCQLFLAHSAPLSSTLVNHGGQSTMDILNETLSHLTTASPNSDSKHIDQWKELKKQMQEMSQAQEEKYEIQRISRQESNQRLRQRQEELNQEHQQNTSILRNPFYNATRMTNRITHRDQINGLGSLEEGYGYFPSLLALQFQGSIPPPPATFASVEQREKKRMTVIMKYTLMLVFLLWILG